MSSNFSWSLPPLLTSRHYLRTFLSLSFFSVSVSICLSFLSLISPLNISWCVLFRLLQLMKLFTFSTFFFSICYFFDPFNPYYCVFKLKSFHFSIPPFFIVAAMHPQLEAWVGLHVTGQNKSLKSGSVLLWPHLTQAYRQIHCERIAFGQNVAWADNTIL